ncbi:hypothetical protein C8A01DRAFT_19919 [Parachaetomium inaequale]|uniref:Complex 1 LYR protein domain-containing protein n=1 Tax=Parachaetomium inaequale TaxID=2588326 RepID=A0AAN6P7C2_9PEZI|nr:hypothetical protein C8A01DRAFT_19919 [Parachaetomium inaequale]
MPSRFLPARSSRHRVACFALYRSLLRQGLRVPLPDDLSTTSPLGPANPIQTLIRNAFRRNKRDESPRLVVSALKNGYRYLTLLSHATDPSTPEHASILTFLRSNQTRVLTLKKKTAAQAATRISTAPNPDRVPLLTKISADGESPPVYAPTSPHPRPLSAFRSGVRKPPTLAAATGVPFLRFWKPMPRFLERVIRQKTERRQKRIFSIIEMHGEGMEDARDEDRWERLVEGMLREEKGGSSGRGEAAGEGGSEGEGTTPPPEVWDRTYRQTLWEAIEQTSAESEREREDMVARAKAMWDIVVAEQEMAVQEEKERLVREGKEGQEPRPRVWKRSVHKKGRNRGPGKGEQAQEKEKQPKQVKILRVLSIPRTGSEGTPEETKPAGQ